MLGAAERRLARIAKYLRNLPSFAALNAIVEIFEDPAKSFAHGPAHSALACAHESDQDYGPRSATRRYTLALNRKRRPRSFSTPLAPIRFALGFAYCFSERFLRWILPLKVRKTTVEESATRPMVPAKARPLSIEK